MSNELETVTLFGAEDTNGRRYLTDSWDKMPIGVIAIQEFPMSPNKVEAAVLAVQLEEIRCIPVTIRVGDFEYSTAPDSFTLSKGTEL